MRTKTIPILGLILVSLVLQGEDCLLEQKEISAVIGTTVPAEFETRGHTESTDTETDVVDVGEEILDALDDAGIDIRKIQSIRFVGVCAEVDSSWGHDARRAGSIVVNGVTLLTFDVPTNVAGTRACSGGSSPGITLSKAGVDSLNGWIDDFLQGLKAAAGPGKGMEARLVLTYTASWTSTPAPSGADPDNFDWHFETELQTTYTDTLDVPSI